MAAKGVKNQNVEDISSQQIDTGPLIPGFFPFLLDMICIANGSSVALAFSRVRKDWGGWGDLGVPTRHRPLYTP